MMTGRTQRLALVFGAVFLSAVGTAWPQEIEPEPVDVDLLIEALWHREPRIRQNAVNRLAQMPEKPFAPLVKVLSEGDPFQSATAAVVLARLKTPGTPLPEDIEAGLYQILRRPGTEAWRWNMTATLLAGVPNAPTPGMAYSADDPAARRETGIAEDNLQDYVDLWTWGVRHPSPLVQLPSLRALQKTGPHGKPAQATVESLLHRQGPPLTSYVLQSKLVTDGKIGLEEPIPQYDPLVILETLVAIQADPQLTAGPLSRLMHHPSEYVRLDAAAMLGKIDAEKLAADPRPEAAKVLAGLAVLPWGNVRAEAVRELGNIGAPSAVVLDTLIKLLEDREDGVRIEAAVALGKIGAPAASALPALKKALGFAELDNQEAVNAIQTAIQAIEDATEANGDTI